MRQLLSFGFLIGLLLLVLPVEASVVTADDGTNCGDLENAYGPFDYTNPIHFKEKLPVVETHHFTPEVERLEKGKEGTVAEDLDYTLRTFPNHHRALYAMARLQIQEPREVGATGYFPARCYFIRAIRFKPDDGIVRAIFAVYLHKAGRLNEAEREYKNAFGLLPKPSSELYYNYALLLLEKGDDAGALENAKKAYELGYPLPGIKNKLKARGVWKDE